MKIKSFLKTPFFYCLLLLHFGFLLLAAARFIPGFADGYYEIIYKNLGGLFGSITGIFPFSLMEAGICLLGCMLIVWI